jgi:hypothetical protein
MVIKDTSMHGVHQCSAVPEEGLETERMQLPETPEGVALFLMNLILEKRGALACGGELSRAELLALYAECLRIARGREDLSHDFLH